MGRSKKGSKGTGGMGLFGRSMMKQGLPGAPMPEVEPHMGGHEARAPKVHPKTSTGMLRNKINKGRKGY